MRSRMKLFLLLLFIGITGIVFVSKKYHEFQQPTKNFLEEEEDLLGLEEKTKEETKEETKKEASISELEKEKESGSIFVHVCGAIKKEGVYELKEGSRVVDAILLAGGFSEEAAIYAVNQAELLTDGRQLYIPFKEENPKMGLLPSPSHGQKDQKVNLNTATKEELMRLPGVGETRALSILQFREEKGRFQDIKDVMKIRGIKQNLFDKIKDKITV